MAYMALKQKLQDEKAQQLRQEGKAQQQPSSTPSISLTAPSPSPTPTPTRSPSASPTPTPSQSPRPSITFTQLVRASSKDKKASMVVDALYRPHPTCVSHHLTM